MTGRASPLTAWLIACYAFLYAPIAFLVALSFNASRLVTTWDGFSLRWYATLWQDQALIAAALLSLRIAAVSATLALIVGTLAGTRWPGSAASDPRRIHRRAGRAAGAAGGDHRPLAAPAVRRAAAGDRLARRTRRGTVTLAHASVSVAYVAVVVRARLAGTPADLEEAAMDLYAPPWKAFTLITLPLMAPALVSGWLLAFTLSLDDVVVASFTSGPGGSTLPMVVFSSIKLGPTPELYALATVIVAVVAAMLLGVWRVQGGGK